MVDLLCFCKQEMDLLGFDIREDGRVLVDHAHNRFGVTRIDGNPTIARSRCGLTVYSIFKRMPHRLKGSKAALKGDNCPMIYALKGKQGLYTTRADIKLLYQSGNAILSKLLAGVKLPYDSIFPMPSAHGISASLARRVHRLIPDALFTDQVLQKSTVQDVKRQLVRVSLPHSDYAVISLRIKRMEADVGLSGECSVKEIPVQLRHHIAPVKLTTAIPEQAYRILLVDDLFSSGATLFAARDLLQRCFPTAQIEALCLFSPLRGKIKER